MHPRAVMATIVALGMALCVVIWMGRVSDQSITVDTLSDGSLPEEKIYPEIVTTGPLPEAVFEETHHHFGVMKHLTSSSHKFIVRNEGEGPLELKAGDTTCQCTVGELGENVVPPGESTVVELKWTIKNPATWFEHTANIHTNDSSNEIVTLTIGGFVGRDLLIKPEGTWSMGNIGKSADSRFEGWVLSELHEDMELIAAEVTGDTLSAEYEKLTAEEIEKQHRLGTFVDLAFPSKKPPPPLTGYRVIIRPVKDVVIGQFAYNLSFTARLNDTLPEIRQEIAVTGVKSGPVDFFALPGTRWIKGRMLINAGEIEAAKGQTVGLMLFVRGREEKFEVTDIEHPLEWLNVTTEVLEKVGKADRVKLNVEFPADCPQLVRTETNPISIVLKTNHPEASEITLKLAFTIH
ncbi:MAG: DUF1573 domain-containing protein [Planctomycetaceae bacterium]